MITVSWSTIKKFVDDRSLSIQWLDDGGFYYLTAIDNYFAIGCSLNKNNPNDELIDFETNYKANGNKSPNQNVVVLSQPNSSPFASKTVTVSGATKKLYKRVNGIQFNAQAGNNTILFTIPYPACKMTGVELVGGESLDTASLFVLDSVAGTYTTVANMVLNQFGFNVNVTANYHSITSQYDADVYQGMQLQITYNSKSAKMIGINFILDEVK